MQPAADTIPRSLKFVAPGTVPSPARVARVRRALIDELEVMAADHGFRLESSPDLDERVVRRDDLSLPWLCDFVEAGLKRAIRCMSADLIGGPCVTRLDRSLTHSHPRLPYRRALRIVSKRGWRLPLGEDLPSGAQASLVRFCGLLPVQIMYLPGQPGPTSLSHRRQGLSYVLPWAGEALQGELPLDGAAGPAVCRFRLDRILQFMLGVEDAAGLGAPSLAGLG